MIMKVVANRKLGGAAICVVIGLGAIGCGDNRQSDNRQSIDGLDPASEAPASQGSGS